MILTDEGALILLVLLGLYALILLGIAGLGVFLMMRGKRVIGAGIVAAVVAYSVIPHIQDRIRLAELRDEIAAVTTIPGTLELTGQRVLFIESGNTICGEICGDVVGIGTQAEVSWIGAGGFIEDGPADHPLLGVLGDSADVLRVELGPPLPDLGDQRFAEQMDGQGGYAPPYDVVIIDDDQGLIAFGAPDLLGADLGEDVDVQFARLVFTNWPDPFGTPPPAPTYRSIAAWSSLRSLAFWPFSNTTDTLPSLTETDALWRGAICGAAGTPDQRDAFTYDYLCDRQSIGLPD